MLSLTISGLMIASCTFPLHQGTLLRHWMVYNCASSLSWTWTKKLKLNPDETEFLLIGNKRQQSKYLCMFPTEPYGVKTNPAKSAWNLGSTIWQQFHLLITSAVCSSCFYHIQDLWRIRPYLDLDRAKLLATAPVSSRLDYCNSLVWYHRTDITKLQRIQNRRTRIMIKSPPITRSVPLLRSLYN